jgi:transcriptional regulator with XRE-family HTH domain
MNQNDVNDVNDVLLLTDQKCALHVGKRLCLARQSLGLTTQVLAELLGTSGAKITEVEQGKLFLPAPWGNKLDRFLGINKIWLLTGEQQITMKKTIAYNDLFNHMRAPEVGQYLMAKFSDTKVLLKDRIRTYERVHGVSLAAAPQ